MLGELDSAGNYFPEFFFPIGLGLGLVERGTFVRLGRSKSKSGHQKSGRHSQRVVVVSCDDR